MYEVNLINDEEITLINSSTITHGAPRLLAGKVNLGINTIDSFSFNISPYNPGYNKLFPYKSKIEVIQKLKGVEKLIFKGRVLLPTNNMDSSGNFSKKVVCESELAYLLDSTQTYGEYHNISVKDFLKIIIDNHNKKQPDKKFVVGEVTVKDNNDSLYRYLGYDKTLDTIKEKLINTLGGELRIRYEGDIRYLDYLEIIGEKKPTEIRLSKNMITIEQEKDPTSIKNRITPLGSKKEDTEERLTIASVNNGVTWVDDIESQKEFGILEDSIIFDDVNTPSVLKDRGLKKLEELNKIKKKHKLSIVDLALIGIDKYNIDIYNYYRVINQVMGIDEYLRVIEQSIDILAPQSSTITIGDKFEDIKRYQNDISQRAVNNVKNLSENISRTNNKVNSLKNDVVDVDNHTKLNEIDIKKQKKYMIMGV